MQERSGALLALLTLLAVAVWISAARPLNGTLEAESAEIARQFLKLGDWTVNHMNGAEDYDKPPLFYWVIAGLKTLSGAPWELAARLPSLLALLALVAAFRAFPTLGERRVSPLLAGALLLASPKILSMTHTARMDLMLCALLTLALLAFHHYWRKRASPKEARRLLLLFYLLLALAVMTKGPVGLILLMVPACLFVLWEREPARLREILLGRGMALFLLLALPWFVVTSLVTEGRFFQGFILDENLSRFGNLFGSLNFVRFEARPFWQYLPLFFGGFFPWVLLLPGAIHRVLNRPREERGGTRLLLLYAGWVLLFFSLSGIKRHDYILPIYPVAAWLVAAHLQFFMPLGRLRAALAATGVLELLLLALLATLPWWTAAPPVRDLFNTEDLQHAARYAAFLLAHPAATGAVALALTLIWLAGVRSSGRGLMVGALLLFQALFLATLMVTMEEVDSARLETRPYIRAIAREVDDHPLYSYPGWDEEYGFYLDRTIAVVQEPRRLRALLQEAGPPRYVLMEPETYRRLFAHEEQRPHRFCRGMPPEHAMLLLSNRLFAGDDPCPPFREPRP